MSATKPLFCWNRRLRKIMWQALCILAAVMLLWWGFLYLMQDKLMFPIAHNGAKAPGRLPPELGEKVVLTRALPQGQVEAWLLRSAAASAEKPAGLIVYFHGNGELIDDQPWGVKPLVHRGWHVLLVEYRGYGRSAGNPAQAAIREDALWFLEEVLKRPDVDGKRVVYYGRSLGGGVAADLALHRPPAGLVMEATFYNSAYMARRFYAPPFLIRNPYRNDLAVAAVQAPLLILHGDQDDMIEPAQAEMLHKLAPESRLVKLPGWHGWYTPQGQQMYWEALAEFLGKL